MPVQLATSLYGKEQQQDPQAILAESIESIVMLAKAFSKAQRLPGWELFLHDNIIDGSILCFSSS